MKKELETIEDKANTVDNDSVELYLKSLAGFKVLTKEQESQLFMAYKSGDAKAKDFIVNSNLKLVVSIAKSYLNKGLPFSDLIQEGNLGLLKAIDKFDYSRGFKFSTYATWWIRQSIGLAIGQKSQLIRLPNHVNNQIKLLKKTIVNYKNIFGCEPTSDDLAKILKISPNKVNYLLSYDNSTLSIDSLVNTEDNSLTILDNIDDETVGNPETLVENSFLRYEMKKLLEDVEPIQRKVLTLRYGLDSGPVRSYTQIGKKLSLNSQKIKQLETKSLKHLKNQVMSRELNCYIS